MINISFFSYKGGAGRTSLLYNTIPFLAEQLGANENEPIIVIDFDIDSKGLSYLITGSSMVDSVQILLGEGGVSGRHSGSFREHPFFRQTLPVGNQFGLYNDRSVLFVSANSSNHLGNNNNYDSDETAVQAIEDLKNLCESYNCKAIVMDTPAGNQLATDCALRISNKIVTVMRITRQFQAGTKEFLESEKVSELNGVEFVIVPNAVPEVPSNPDLIPSMISNISNITSTALERTNNNVNLTLLENGRLGINEVNLFKIGEECLNTRKTLQSDELKAIESYQLLARELSK